jgi:ligand-binding sensor domain-containing protein/signal transduction histidine kinase
MRWGTLLPLGILLPFLSLGQQHPIRTYTVADGLAEDRVNSIVADSRGYIWIATGGGLSRFDGYRMKTYGTDDGLPYRTIHALLEMPSGAYLVGTLHGLCRLENGSARPFTAYPVEGQAPSVEAFLKDPSGRILMATSIGVFESAGGMSFRKLPLNQALGDRIVALASDRDGNIWISSETALAILGPHGELAVFQPGRGLPPQVGHAAAMVEQPQGRMWAATNAGLALFDRPHGGAWRFERLFTLADGLAGNDITAIETDGAGRLWLGTSDGISQFAPDGPLPPHFENLGMAQGLSARVVTTLARDPAGNMWAGTENAGVMRIARHGFLTYRTEDGLADERILQVLEGRDGELLAISQSDKPPYRSVGVFDGVGFRSFVPGIMSSDFAWGWQQVLVHARSGEWWAASGHGLLRYRPGKAATLAAAQPVRYAGHWVFRIMEDSRGGIWASAISKLGRELMYWDAASQALSWFCADGTTAAQPCLFSELVGALAEDSAHNIWMGLWDGGLLRYASGSFTRFGTSDGLPPGGIRSLFSDCRGRLWIGAGGGLALLASPAAPHPHFEIYNQKRGLSSNSVLCIAEDLSGRLYLGTARGVDRLDPATGRIRHFSSLDGVPYGGFTSAIRDRSGAIWFGSRSGLLRLLPEAEPPSAPVPPQVLITGLQAGGEDYALSQLGEERIAGLRLPASRNRIQVDFVAPGYESTEDLRYSFQLAGADTAWSEPRAQHSVDYRNLGAGSYRFLVKAVDPEGRESERSAEVAFTILPPLWKRWWFEAALVAAAIALGYSLHAYRLAHILAMERMRTAIATDLHDDIGSSLAQIAVLSDVAQMGASRGTAGGRPMARIGEVARELTGSLNDIVWSIRSGDETLESLTRRMREFAEEFLEAAGIEFSWQASAPPKLKITLNSRRQIFLIFKECLHNIVKHSGCRSASVTFHVKDREAVLTVSDNGKGWKGQSMAGNGLANMRRRAAALGGGVEFGDAPRGGCQVTLRLPVRKRPFGDLVL